eukprot:comp21519_c0_seq1/m.29906 comp21519_c0_seq1/g.29906  ORF comp21519_c0_seq1/g.29906 comp21519_c0_seq1/m.29906 type:complete len:114 (-) comp21519_c0_seq1:585-926(-)
MCKHCIKDPMPSRGTTCTDTGAYVVNYVGCKDCGSLSFPKAAGRTVEEETDGTEETKFTHVCKDCGHVICEHVYTFAVKDDYQEYQMACLLCGFGEDSSHVLPKDPNRGMALF